MPGADGAVAAWEDLDTAGEPRVAWVRTGGPRVAVLIGAFDPPTNAHVAVLRAAARVLERPGVLCLTKVLLDRGRDDRLLGEPERLRVLSSLAAAEGFGFAMANKGTYLEVARALRSEGLDAVFVVGSDKLAQLEDPSFYTDADGVERTFSEVRFLVVPRGDATLLRDDVLVLDQHDVFDDDEAASISATEVRRLVRAGVPVDHLVPRVVAESLEGYTAAEPR